LNLRGLALAAIAALAIAAPGGPAAAGDSVRVLVDLPLPQKIDTRSIHKILIARFMTNDVENMDPGREMVAYMKRILARGTPFQVLDVEPPNLPEQPVEDLLRNSVFWKHIASENGADLVVSGQVSFKSYDRSGFVDEDVVSATTGQKVRTTRFVERQEFELKVNFWFFKGANGALLYEDTFKESQFYNGESNDALQAFYDLSEAMNPDVTGVLVPRKRQDPRIIFTD
jgi:hypothetical protein